MANEYRQQAVNHDRGIRKYRVAADGATTNRGWRTSQIDDSAEGRAAMRRWYVRIDRWHPAKLNQWDGRHWAVRARLKKADANLVAVCCAGAGVAKATGKRRVCLEIVLGPRQRGGDVDAYWKSTLDALKHAGAIVDDSKELVVLGEVCYSRGPVKATVIVLEDVV